MTLVPDSRPTPQATLPSSEATLPSRLSLAADGRLLFSATDGTTHSVRVVRCFPWSEPSRYVSLRDADDAELCFIDRLDALDPGSRSALESALVAAGFVLCITAISSIEEDFEIRKWQVQTAQGARSFQTPLDSWPHATPSGDLVIADVAGDLYVFPNLDGLDANSKKLLWAFID